MELSPFMLSQQAKHVIQFRDESSNTVCLSSRLALYNSPLIVDLLGMLTILVDIISLQVNRSDGVDIPS